MFAFIRFRQFLEFDVDSGISFLVARDRVGISTGVPPCFIQFGVLDGREVLGSAFIAIYSIGPIDQQFGKWLGGLRAYIVSGHRSWSCKMCSTL